MSSTSNPHPRTIPLPAADGRPGRPQAGGGLLGRVGPNSRTHWTLLLIGLVGSVAFNAIVLIDGLLRPGYDWLRQPMSALSLGPGGWVQVANFIGFGILGCVAAFAWRPTLAPGIGATWYPRLRVLAGLAFIGAGLFLADPGGGFPVGAVAPATPTAHALVHNLVSYVSLIVTVAELVILARRFADEPHWRAWSPAAAIAAVLMMAFLAAFGVLVAQGGPAGIFEKLASLTPTLFGIAIVVRLLTRHDARITPECR
jgi:Protein of unknown function (DUF998)